MHTLLHILVLLFYCFVWLFISVFSNRVDCEECNPCACEDCVYDYSNQGKLGFVHTIPTTFSMHLAYFV